MLTTSGQRELSAKAHVIMLTSTHLLRDHNNERSQGSATHSRDGKQLNTAFEIVGPANNLRFNLELSMDVVEITSCLYRAEAQA